MTYQSDRHIHYGNGLVSHTPCLFRFGASLQLVVGEWADRTFSASSPTSIIAHAVDEFFELREMVGNERVEEAAEEAADCFLLLLHLAHKLNVDLLTVAIKKFETNRARTWERNAGETGYWKHVAEE